jgi:hypothetical protein
MKLTTTLALAAACAATMASAAQVYLTSSHNVQIYPPINLCTYDVGGGYEVTVTTEGSCAMWIQYP